MAPEYVGKMNFYLSLLDKQEKAPDENPSIGIFRFGHPKLQTCQDWPNLAGPFSLLNRDTLFETVSIEGYQLASILLSNTPSNKLISRLAMPNLFANTLQSLTAVATS